MIAWPFLHVGSLERTLVSEMIARNINASHRSTLPFLRRWHDDCAKKPSGEKKNIARLSRVSCIDLHDKNRNRPRPCHLLSEDAGESTFHTFTSLADSTR